MPDVPSEPTPDDFKENADKSAEAGIADETAAYDKAITPTQAGDEADESEAQPS